MKFSGRKSIQLVTFLAVIGFVVSSGFAGPSQKPKRHIPNVDQLIKIDSIQRWAHHFCDSVIAEFSGGDVFADGFDYLRSEIEKQKHLRLDSQADSVFAELRGQLAIPPGHLHLLPMQPLRQLNGGLMFGDSAHHYFLRVVPGMGGPKPLSRRVGKNLWLIEEEVTPPTE
jgi:hypothetical protein